MSISVGFKLLLSLYSLFLPLPFLQLEPISLKVMSSNQRELPKKIPCVFALLQCVICYFWSDELQVAQVPEKGGGAWI